MKVFIACLIAFVSSLEYAPTVDNCSKCIGHETCRPVYGPDSRPFYCVCPNGYIMKDCTKQACFRAKKEDGSVNNCVYPITPLTQRPEECSTFVQKQNGRFGQEWSCFQGHFHEVSGYSQHIYYTCEGDSSSNGQLFSLFANGTHHERRGSSIFYSGTHTHEPLNVFTSDKEVRYGSSVAVQMEATSVGKLHHVNSPDLELLGFYCIKLKDQPLRKFHNVRPTNLNVNFPY